MRLSAETDLDAVVSTVEVDPPELLVVDSIQSVYDPGIETAHGSVTQLRECTLRLHRVAKARQIAMLLIGHVTKEGVLAGPRVVEHLVDAVLYLEGERLQSYRLLRSVKNRFGATNEVGVFEMRDGGLIEVSDPAALFISDRVHSASGSAVVVTAEGTRPMLAEVQALVTRTTLAMPRRMASGIDLNRVLLIAAVLAKRAGAALHSFDIHLNVVGGLRIEEPAADLAMALAMLSSYRDVALDPNMVAIGEIGLAGELRAVSQTDLRLREAARLGYRRAIVPAGALVRWGPIAGIDVAEAATLQEAAGLAGVQ
jgi:DNA repair protein RadA/Sms